MKSQSTFLFTSNGDYQNRGCEAISRGTIAILQRAFDTEIGIHWLWGTPILLRSFATTMTWTTPIAQWI